MTERSRRLQAQLIADAGGDDISTAKRVVIQRACALIVELELRELRWANSEPLYYELEQHSRISSNLRRMLEAIGLDRKNVMTLDPLDYANGKDGKSIDFAYFRKSRNEGAIRQRREALDET